MVKIGWPWPGFFFTWIWALVKKLWGIGFGVFAVAFVVMIVQMTVAVEVFDNRNGLLQGTMPLLELLLEANIILLLAQYIGLPVVFGIMGNSWRGSRLLRCGFELKQTVAARNALDAIPIYLKDRENSTSN